MRYAMAQNDGNKVSVDSNCICLFSDGCSNVSSPNAVSP